MKIFLGLFYKYKKTKFRKLQIADKRHQVRISKDVGPDIWALNSSFRYQKTGELE